MNSIRLFIQILLRPSKPQASRILICHLYLLDASISLEYERYSISDHRARRAPKPPNGINAFQNGQARCTGILRLSFKKKTTLCCAISHAYLIYPMRNMSADSFVEVVTYIFDHAKQRFGTKILQFQGDRFSSFMDGGVMMNARRDIGFSTSLFPTYMHWWSIIENYIRHIRDQALRRI